MPQAASTASGNFAACAVESTIIGSAGSRGSFSATAMPTAVCGSTKWPVSRKRRAHGGGDFVLAGAAGGKTAADFRQGRRPRSRSASIARRFLIRRDGRGIAAIGFEQQPLEIRRHLDVHRGRGGRDHLARLIGAGGERAHQDVVDVGCDHQAIDRQPHAARDIARENVAEISGRHREGDLAMRRAERDRGGEIIDRLRHDARPVDRVDAREPHLFGEGVVIEHALHQRLAIVERAFDRDRVDIGVIRGRHHAALHVGDAAVREQHHKIDTLAAAERLDRGAAGVARGRDHDGDALAALLQRVVHQPRQELHGEVFEGERRPVEQLEQEGVDAELRDRRHRRMAEGAIGLARDAREIGSRDLRRRRTADHLDRDLGIGPAGERGDGLGRKRGQDSGT